MAQRHWNTHSEPWVQVRQHRGREYQALRPSLGLKAMHGPVPGSNSAGVPPHGMGLSTHHRRKQPTAINIHNIFNIIITMFNIDIINITLPCPNLQPRLRLSRPQPRAMMKAACSFLTPCRQRSIKTGLV